MDYIIRGIDNITWRRVKARAAMSDETIRDVLLAFLDHYADGDHLPTVTTRLRPRDLTAEIQRAQQAAAAAEGESK